MRHSSPLNVTFYQGRTFSELINVETEHDIESNAKNLYTYLDRNPTNQKYKSILVVVAT